MSILVPFIEMADCDLPSFAPLKVYSGFGQLPMSPELIAFWVMPHPPIASCLELLPELTALKVLQVVSSGVDHLSGLVPRGVVVCNAPNLHSDAVAEMGMSLMLASLNQVSTCVEQQQRELWRDPGSRYGLRGKTVLLLGYGAVGQAIHHMLSGFDVRVIPVARRQRHGVAEAGDLKVLVGQADVVVVAAPRTVETLGIVNRDVLASMKTGALVVNLSRGELVETSALVEELSSGRLTAALDVTEPEPLPPGHPLWQCPGLILSPHIGGHTADFRRRAIAFVTDQLGRYHLGQNLLNVVAENYLRG